MNDQEVQEMTEEQFQRAIEELTNYENGEDAGALRVRLDKIGELIQRRRVEEVDDDIRSYGPR